METTQTKDTGQRRDLFVPGFFTILTVTIHVATYAPYGIFRDELYYLDCARHLDFGYVDHPPLSILILAVARALLGDGAFAIRLPAFLASGLVVFMGGFTARAMGGGRFAQAATCMALFIAPIFLGTGSFFSMNPFDQLFWAVGFYLLARIIVTDDPRLWLWFGLVAGFGLQNKMSMAFFGIALAVALPFTPQRKHFRHWQLYAGGVLALVIFLPNLIWQAKHGWPTAEFMRYATLFKNKPTTPWAYALDQTLMIHPVNVLICAAGLLSAFFGREGRRFRLLGLLFAILFLNFSLTNGKAYYLAPAYAGILALGAIWIEKRTAVHQWPRIAWVAISLALGAVTAPLAMPVLPIDVLPKYMAAIHLAPPQQERGHTTAVGQHLGDRFGWPEMAAMVAQVYHELPEGDRQRCGIFASNYGQGGAINYYGPDLGLPRAAYAHNSGFLWGPGALSGEVVLVYGGNLDRLNAAFEEVREIRRFQHPYAMPYEQDVPLFLCRSLRIPLEVLWPSLKHFG